MARDLYPVESFTPDEAARLTAHVTNLTEPVFALTNLPETVKGAMFARYSRYPGTLRRLFLDEFAGTLPALGENVDAAEGKRAADIFERVFVGFGDDSVAQLGGVHIACEWTSNILTKILQRPRIGSYLEQSTRYIAYDNPVEGTGRYRYFRHPELGDAYERSMDSLFATYSELLERMTGWMRERYPRGEQPEGPWMRATRAKALDACRGLLPAGSLSHMGIYATGQTYEQLVLHLMSHPLPEAREYGELMLRELKQVIPSFLARVERPDRGGVWAAYLHERRRNGQDIAERLGLRGRADTDSGPQVTLVRHHGTETDLLCALLFEETDSSEVAVADAVGRLGGAERVRLLSDLLGGRSNRRHRPGRGMETVSYRFEIVSDYGAFRDLQRHRMLTQQWQQLGVDLGAEVPEDIDAAGCGDTYRAALARSAAEYERLRDIGAGPAASYAVCLAYRMRYVMELNAREAMQLTELRSGREGHPSYRAVALAMADRIAEVHPTLGAAFTFLDRETDPRLERIAAEIRTESKLAQRQR